MRNNPTVLIIVIIALFFISYQKARYVIKDDEQVVITQFGKVIGEAKAVPGEYFKIPIVQEAHYFKKTLYLYENAQEIPTKDKKFISLKKRAYWKISDPIQFYKKLNSYELAKEFILDHTGEAERNIITSHTLSEIIGKNHDGENLIGAKCSRSVEQKILDMAKQPLFMSGISLNNIEATVTYPKDAREP
jgi:modulator of FtsH protease HflC